MRLNQANPTSNPSPPAPLPENGARGARKVLELDAAAISQTKQQISGLVAEIAELAKLCEAPANFYPAMLSRLVTAMAATGAAIWQRRNDGIWQLVHSSTLPESLILDQDDNRSKRRPNSLETTVDRLATLVENELDSDRDAKRIRIEAGHRKPERAFDEDASRMREPTPEHLSLLECVAREQQPILVPPGDIASNNDRPTNPIQQSLIYSPIPVETGQGQLWLQVVQPPSGGIASQRGYLRFVAQIADLTADFLKTYRLRQYEYEQRLFTAAEQLLSDAAKPGDAKPKLIHLVQQLRELTGADQVILVQRPVAYRSWQIVIVSGLRDFDQRSEGSQCIAEFCQWNTQQSRFDRPLLVYAPDRQMSGALDDQVASDDAIPRDRFMSMFSAAAAAWLPIMGGTSERPWGVACLAYWSWPTNRPENTAFERLAQRAQDLGRLGVDAIRPPQLRYAIEVARSDSGRFDRFAMRCWTSRWVRLAIATAIIAGIAMVPVPLRVIAPATLQPRLQFRHYAPLDARIATVHVDYGQKVTAGQVLLELEDRQLSNLLDDAVSQQLKSKERRRDIEARLLRGDRLQNDLRYELEGELETLRALANNEQQRIEALQKQMSLLTILAAEDGVIATWNAKQLLQDRPVRVGQMLLLVQQPDGPWTVEARVSQQDVGKFLEATRHGMPSAHCSLSSHPNQRLPAVYQPSELPAMLAADQDASEQSSLCVRFAVPLEELPQRNAGSTAQVTIDIGRGPLVWSVFGDAVVSLWAKVRLWI